MSLALSTLSPGKNPIDFSVDRLYGRGVEPDSPSIAYRCRTMFKTDTLYTITVLQRRIVQETNQNILMTVVASEVGEQLFFDEFCTQPSGIWVARAEHAERAIAEYARLQHYSPVELAANPEGPLPPIREKSAFVSDLFRFLFPCISLSEES